MSDGKKSAWDVFGGNNGYSPERIRGGFLNWAQHYNNKNGDWQPTCVVSIERFENKNYISPYRNFENWVRRNVEGWDDFRDSTASSDEFLELFADFFQNNDKFRELCGEFWKLAYEDHDKDGVMLKDYSGGHKTDVKEFDGDGDSKSSHRLSELKEVGIIDENNDIQFPKLRGTVVSFAKSVDEITADTEEPDLNELMTAWNRWMKDKFDSGWVTFMVERSDPELMFRQVEYVWNNVDEFSDIVQDKWVHDAEELEGNSGRDDSNKSRWERFEERSDELDYEPPEDNGGVGKQTLDNFEDEAIEKETPEFEINSVYRGDARDMLRDMRNANVTADALVCDPPYGLDFESRGEGRSIEGDATVDEAMGLIEQIFKLSRIVLKEGAPVIVFCGDVNLGEVVLLVKNHFDYEQTLTWNKQVVGLGATGKGDSRAPRWRSQHEFAVYAGKGEMDFQNSKRHDGSVLEFKKLQGDEMEHPTEKPQKMLRYIIEGVTNENDLVIDPFAGSGSTLMAAKSCGRQYVGAELDKEFQDVIENRLNQQVLSV